MDSTFIILTLAALLTSILSGTIGMGGGILLLAVMAQYFPLAVLIPLHGIIQLFSNTSRVIYSYKYFQKHIVIHFAIGAILGAVIGSQVVLVIPDTIYKIILGFFIISLTFIRSPKFKVKSQFKWISVGGVSTFLGILLGATGPLIAPFYLSENLRKDVLVATKAACQIFTHLFKVITFFMIGFAIGPHLPILAVMTAMVFLGNYIGKLLLHQVSDKWFLWIFQGAIVCLSVRMIFQGFLVLSK
ncbi:MAG: sulfite exporter TauE/SafE family protein [Deltaproteobacteria bacterium]|nr:sulfite exporter TauE/SafE family protein [Deltaproteobacteria bacterium]